MLLSYTGCHKVVIISTSSRDKQIFCKVHRKISAMREGNAVRIFFFRLPENPDSLFKKNREPRKVQKKNYGSRLCRYAFQIRRTRPVEWCLTQGRNEFERDTNVGSRSTSIRIYIFTAFGVPRRWLIWRAILTRDIFNIAALFSSLFFSYLPSKQRKSPRRERLAIPSVGDAREIIASFACLQFQIAQTSSNNIRRGRTRNCTSREHTLMPVNVTIAHSFFVARARAPFYQEVRISRRGQEAAKCLVTAVLRHCALRVTPARRNVPRWVSIHESGHVCWAPSFSCPRAPGDESLHSPSLFTWMSRLRQTRGLISRVHPSHVRKTRSVYFFPMREARKLFLFNAKATGARWYTLQIDLITFNFIGLI